MKYKHFLIPIVFYSVLFFIADSQEVNGQTFNHDLDVGVHQRIDLFSRIFDPQYQTSFHALTSQNRATYIVRLNHARKFNLKGNQWETEIYPTINSKTYAYLGYAWSGDQIFPNYRYGVELFRAWPRDSEISLGMRYLNFTTGSETYIITASASHYYEAWLFSIRPFLILSDSGRGQSLIASARYFLSDYGDHIIFRAGIGVSPDSRTVFIDDGIFDEQQLLLQSMNLGAEFQYNILDDLTGRISLDWHRRELSFDTGNFVGNWSIVGGLTYSLFD